MSKTIDIQGHKFIAALIDYFEKERDNVGPLLLVNTVREEPNILNDINHKALKDLDDEIYGQPLPLDDLSGTYKLYINTVKYLHDYST
ncbi:hypothetical protein GWI33_022864 [Rhynchophorus ferrugineus]|uniref:Uncharacterized protein n=1 Tax=Rhynchophorus ferrugineus TaxID=354439 RepID=A0A834ITU3_RHYFE|nr:hypothetical protein GWI33_022864 [Rhynchophorus ferrugineus]